MELKKLGASAGGSGIFGFLGIDGVMAAGGIDAPAGISASGGVAAAPAEFHAELSYAALIMLPKSKFLEKLVNRSMALYFSQLTCEQKKQIEGITGRTW